MEGRGRKDLLSFRWLKGKKERRQQICAQRECYLVRTGGNYQVQEKTLFPELFISKKSLELREMKGRGRGGGEGANKTTH